MSVRNAVVVLAVLVLASAQASASAIFNVQYGTNPAALSTWTPADLGEEPNPDGTVSFSGNSPFGGGNFQASWNVLTDLDPFVDGVFAITNNTLVTQTFIISFIAPVLPPLGSASGGASVSGTLTVNGDGGTLGHNGIDPFFTAIVDNSDFMGLLAHDSSVTLAFGSDSTGSDFFGLPGLTEPIPGGVSTNIGIRLAFTLTPGDSASFTSRFEVVPEPTTGLLVGAGLVVLALRRRS